MSAKIKYTQLTRVGYTYQDLMCIHILVNWFHEPDRYQWVCIEGTKAKGRFKGLDDVIAFNKEGRYELLQVKFTIDSERDDLKFSFDWLLEKTEKGTSFLQKWESDTAKYNAEDLLSVAALKTNRVPDDEVEKCLCNNKINIDLVPENHLEKIKEQLGGYQKAKEFFDLFTFDHSQPEIDDFENKLKDGLVPDHCPTEEGWFRFLKAVERWATRENEPAPDGRIKIEHIRDLLTTGSSSSISQFFEIPEGYILPSEGFHADIVEKTKSFGCWVISGLPGMGKSTYLSYLTESLIGQDIPVIRHHYSLSAQTVIDRITYPNAARSLQSQLQLQFTSLFNGREYDPECLDEWIKMASDEASQQDKKLVVIIDGLDHVARERSDITQLEHLVNKLIPLRDKVCLILGTQPVSDAQLPSLLIPNVPRDQYWLNLPPMDLNAIKSWIKSLSKNEEVSLVGGDDYKARELVEVSEAFLKISGGYPLHLIYSIKSLSTRNKHLTKYDIERLSTCPDGDIHNYYATLWSNLSASAREILLLIACVEFPWPDENSIGSCFQDSLLFKEAFNEIQHLIERRRSGIVTFHGSVLVFLRKRQEYRDSLNELLTKVQTWLAESAPEYWHWGWDWIIKANLGDIEP
ncbi:MAG: ATP-binding protein, partial [Alphaproteobacteria bacterium]|nr:ATP-binding protein [Alphaproteobacteria bacterium]